MVRIGAYASLIALLCLAGCGAGGKDARSREQPLGGAPELEALLAAAQNRAAPEGAVLVVFWTTASPASASVWDLAERWHPYGLATIGICLDLVDAADRTQALAAVRDWERRNRIGVPSLLYEGSAESLSGRFDGAGATVGLLLLDPEGKKIWAASALGEIEDLDAILQVRLGLPPLAGREEGCVC